MAGSLGDLGGLLKQAQKMQRQVAELQDELAKQTFEGSAGGGMVKVTVNGKKELLGISIKPDAVDPEEVELLEDMVSAAFKDAFQQAESASDGAMKGITGGLGMPGMM
ncbi:MAG: YbaB/EbfC family nucleoid-associated protein [Planctomycetes bacterium]|nr:YbaB/EbfC family nucleoid-associated protein [Planctomycetota bacterium]